MTTTTKKLLALATITTMGFTFSASAQSADDVAKNSAIAASPRAKEVFPWLARGDSPAPSSGRVEAAERAEVLKNQAYAASPRAKEVFPWLARTAAADCTCPTVALVK